MFSTPDLFDAHRDKVSVSDSGLSHYGGVHCFAGQAYTVTCPEDNSQAVEVLSEAGAGRVLVIDGFGTRHFAFLGDMMAQNAIDHGWAGVIVNGCVRDIEILANMSLGVMALGVTPRSTVKRGFGHKAQPVSMLSMTIHPGDWIYADSNGVLVSAEALPEVTVG